MLRTARSSCASGHSRAGRDALLRDPGRHARGRDALPRVRCGASIEREQAHKKLVALSLNLVADDASLTVASL
jgi:hypothetical protein